MPYAIIRDDITKINVDAIVNAANKSLLGGGGVDGTIHRAAGPKLRKECLLLNGCDVGQAKITKGYDLPAKYVIHTVGPEWEGGGFNEEELLANCYKSSIEIAKKYRLKSIAFPLISTGAFRFPIEKALNIATSEIASFLMKNDMIIYLIVYDKASLKISTELFSSIKEYIDDHYVEENTDVSNVRVIKSIIDFKSVTDDKFNTDIESTGDDKSKIDIKNKIETEYNDNIRYSVSMPEEERVSRNLEDVVKNVGETFSQMLLRLIIDRNLEDSEVYKKANIDRKLFSKIRINIHYKPSKATVFALAIALQLNIDETKDLLRRAGFAFSDSDVFDIIVQYHIENEIFDIFEINHALFVFDQKTLGV